MTTLEIITAELQRQHCNGVGELNHLKIYSPEDAAVDGSIDLTALAAAIDAGQGVLSEQDMAVLAAMGITFGRMVFGSAVRMTLTPTPPESPATMVGLVMIQLGLREAGAPYTLAAHPVPGIGNWLISDHQELSAAIEARGKLLADPDFLQVFVRDNVKNEILK